MNLKRSVIVAVGLMLGLAGAGLLHAQTDDVFAFIPAGGRTLLERAAGAGLQMDAILAGKRSREEWQLFLQGKPAVKELSESEFVTLADYLAHNMPIAPGAALPRDGRDLALEYCQSCHIITVVVTQDRSKVAWLGSLNKPSHIEIELTAAERGALADYLVLNAAIPIDLVPEELRAGGATY